MLFHPPLSKFRSQKDTPLGRSFCSILSSRQFALMREIERARHIGGDSANKGRGRSRSLVVRQRKELTKQLDAPPSHTWQNRQRGYLCDGCRTTIRRIKPSQWITPEHQCLSRICEIVRYCIVAAGEEERGTGHREPLLASIEVSARYCNCNSSAANENVTKKNVALRSSLFTSIYGS